jgi:ParB family transcriptional regulator, chromosome partitioning protein
MKTAFENNISHSAGSPGEIQVWDVAHLKPNPLNPRTHISEEDPKMKELAQSIKTQGLLEPIIITPNAFVVAGHRRRLACIIAGVKRVRVIVQRLTEAEQLQIMMVENLQREDLTPLQEANGYKALLACEGITINEASRRLARTHAHIQLRLDIHRLHPATQKLFDSWEMQVASVRHLLKINDPDRQMKLAQMVKTRRMTVQIPPLRDDLRGYQDDV